MTLLLLEIWIYLTVAFFLGMFVQWFFCCRDKKNAESTNTTPLAEALESTDNLTTESKDDLAMPANEFSSSDRPLGFTSAPDDADELKRIKGVGAVIETTLNELGIYKFEQIAEWNSDNIAWVENHIAFPGRIQREEWVSQAEVLSKGGSTEFAKRVDTGEVDY